MFIQLALSIFQCTIFIFGCLSRDSLFIISQSLYFVKAFLKTFLFFIFTPLLSLKTAYLFYLFFPSLSILFRHFFLFWVFCIIYKVLYMSIEAKYTTLYSRKHIKNTNCNRNCHCNRKTNADYFFRFIIKIHPNFSFFIYGGKQSSVFPPCFNIYFVTLPRVNISYGFTFIFHSPLSSSITPLFVSITSLLYRFVIAFVFLTVNIRLSSE